MARTNLTKVFEERVKAAMDVTVDSIAAGEAQDYTDYMRSVGRISGLRDALRIIDEIEAELDKQ